MYLVRGKLWYGIKNMLLRFRKSFFAKFVQQQGQEIKSLKQEIFFLYRLLVLTITICRMSHRKSSYNGTSSRTCTCEASVLARIGITFKVSMTMYPSAVTNNADNSSVTRLSTWHCEGNELCKLLSQCLAVSLFLGMWQNSIRFYLALSNVIWVTQRDV